MDPETWLRIQDVLSAHHLERRPCSRTVIHLDAIEEAITRFYRSFQLSPTRVKVIRGAVQTELRAEQTQAEQDQTRARRRIVALTDQRAKLLTAHYTGAVPLDPLKTEMTRLTQEKTDAENELAAASATLIDLAGQLE